MEGFSIYRNNSKLHKENSDLKKKKNSKNKRKKILNKTHLDFIKDLLDQEDLTEEVCVRSLC